MIVDLFPTFFIYVIVAACAFVALIIPVFLLLYIFMLDRLFRFWFEITTVLAIAAVPYCIDNLSFPGEQLKYNYAKEYATLNERNSMYLANNKYADRDWYADGDFYISAGSRGYNEFYNCDHAQVSTGESVPMDDSSEGNEDGYGSFRSAEFLDY